MKRTILNLAAWFGFYPKELKNTDEVFFEPGTRDSLCDGWLRREIIYLGDTPEIRTEWFPCIHDAIVRWRNKKAAAKRSRELMAQWAKEAEEYW